MPVNRVLPAFLLAILSMVAAREYGPQSGDTFNVEGSTSGIFSNATELGPDDLLLPIESITISPLMPADTHFYLEDAYVTTQGILATVPRDSEFFSAMIDGVQEYSPDEEIDASATASIPDGGTFVSGSCTPNCSYWTWTPEFRSYFGTFEPSGVRGQIAIPFSEGRIEHRCMPCDGYLPPTLSGAQAMSLHKWKLLVGLGFVGAFLGM